MLLSFVAPNAGTCAMFTAIMGFVVGFEMCAVGM